MPEQISRATLSSTWAAAALTAACHLRRAPLKPWKIGSINPIAALIPGAAAAMAAAEEAGQAVRRSAVPDDGNCAQFERRAAGGSRADKIAAMLSAFADAGVECRIISTSIDCSGVIL